jgi:hypothetical protein
LSLAIDTSELDRCITWCGDPAALAGAAEELAKTGPYLTSAGASMVSTWQRLDGCYFAPETTQLVGAIRPVGEQANTLAGSVGAVVGTVREFAEKLTGLKSRMEELKRQAVAFEQYAAAHPDWVTGGDEHNPSGNRATFEQGTNVGVHAGVVAHEWHDRIVQDIEKATADFLEADAECAHAVMAHVREQDAPAAGGAPEKLPADLAAEQSLYDQLSDGKHPFGDLWIDKGPLLDRMGVGFAKSLFDGASGLSSLFGVSFNWDPVTGEGKFDFGWHVLKRTYLGLGKLAMLVNPTALAGAGVLAMFGVRTPWKSMGTTGKGIFEGFTGAGLPGGWAVRGGYILGNVTQAATPGPGKGMLAGAVLREDAIGTAARLAEAGGKGHWILGDMRLAGRLPVIGERFDSLGDALHNLTPVRALSERVNRLKFDLGLGRERVPADADPLGPDIGHANGVHAQIERDTLDRMGHLADQAAHERAAGATAGAQSATSRGLLSDLRRELDRGLTQRRVYAEQADDLSRAGDRAGLAEDHVGGQSVHPVHGPDGPGTGYHVPAPVRRLDPEQGIRGFGRAMHSGDRDELLGVARAGDDEPEYVGIRSIQTPRGTRREVFFHHEVGDAAHRQEADTVFGAIHDGRLVQFKHPRTLLSRNGDIVAGAAVPKEVRELYATQLGKSAWEAVPAHNLREAAAQSTEGPERIEERREPREELAEAWEAAEAARRAVSGH